MRRLNDGEHSWKILGIYASGGESTEIGYVYKESMIPHFFLRRRSCPNSNTLSRVCTCAHSRSADALANRSPMRNRAKNASREIELPRRFSTDLASNSR